LGVNSYSFKRKDLAMEREMMTEKRRGSDALEQEKRIQSKKPKERSLNQVLQSLADALRHFQPKQVSQKRRYLTGLADQLDIIRRILTDVLIIGLFIFFGLLTCVEFKKDSVVIEAFEVPEELQKQGYTGRALANKLLDQINFIKETTRTARESREFLPADAMASIEVEIAGTGVSLKSVLQYVKEFFGHSPTRIVGEVTLQGDRDQLYLTIRVIGKPSKTISGTLANLNETLLEAAEHIYKRTDPYTLASYLYSKYQQERSLEILKSIQYCLHHDPPEDDHWAYNLWGLVLRHQKDYDGAIAKYKKAIELDPQFALAYNNWGLVLYDQKDYDGAIAKYKKAIELDPQFALAYNNWGLVLRHQKDYDGAIAKYKKAIELDPQFAFAYNNWGNVLYDQKDYDGAIAKYKKAIEIDPQLAPVYYNLGLAYRDYGQQDEAIKACKQVLELKPDPELTDKVKKLINELIKKE
jgi:tetratricopeptide (TPR) repeat protein